MSKTTKIITHRKYRDVNYLIKEGTGIWILLFKGESINLHTIHPNRACYERIAWAHEAHAKNRATKLNKIFRTDNFSVMRIDA